MSEQISRYKPGQNLPAFAVSQVEAGRFVAVVGGLTPQGDYQIEHATPGSRPLGVAEATSLPPTEDPNVQQRRVNVARVPSVVRVEADGAITAAEEVEVGQDGKVTATEASFASVVIGDEGDNTALELVAKEAGVDGNDITVALVDPEGASESLAVTVAGTDIEVSLATDSESDITSTADDVLQAIEGENDADELVTVSHHGESTGEGVVDPVSETNLTGGTDAGDGPVVGRALTDTENGGFCEVALY